MSGDLTSAFLAALGGGGFVTAGTLVVRAFLQALRATAAVSEQKDRTIDRQDRTIEQRDQTIERLDTEIESLQLKLLAEKQDSAAKDIVIAGLRADLARTTGNSS